MSLYPEIEKIEGNPSSDFLIMSCTRTSQAGIGPTHAPAFSFFLDKTLAQPWTFGLDLWYDLLETEKYTMGNSPIGK
jgi:hypothetical protein